MVKFLINAEKRGLTASLADVSYDIGEIVAQKSVEFNFPLKIDNAIKLVKPLYFDLVKDIYRDIVSGKIIKATAQKNMDATYSLWLDEKTIL